ncbi:hypothetical protein QP185_10605 [Sphingomonas aerolata]|uniref:hypothetical protein n=1 Tax=Sphingomonas aerolata TaxID=185951 RepID=UPI002FE1AB41
MEARLVAAAAAQMSLAGGREPIARVIAQRVVDELSNFVDGGDDPLVTGLAEIRRAAFPSPFHSLATDPAVDTLSLFVDRRVEKLRARAGRYLSPHEAKTERQELLSTLECVLTRRYLRHLRASAAHP